MKRLKRKKWKVTYDIKKSVEKIDSKVVIYKATIIFKNGKKKSFSIIEEDLIKLNENISSQNGTFIELPFEDTKKGGVIAVNDITAIYTKFIKAYGFKK